MRHPLLSPIPGLRLADAEKELVQLGLAQAGDDEVGEFPLFPQEHSLVVGGGVVGCKAVDLASLVWGNRDIGSRKDVQGRNDIACFENQTCRAAFHQICWIATQEPEILVPLLQINAAKSILLRRSAPRNDFSVIASEAKQSLRRYGAQSCPIFIGNWY